MQPLSLAMLTLGLLLASSSSAMASPLPATNAAGAAAIKMPEVKLNNGVMMPVMSLGSWQLNESTTEAQVALGLKTGFTHIDTAWNYHNQDAVGRALHGRARDSFFLTTKVPSCSVYYNSTYCADVYSRTKELLAFGLARLGLKQVDLMLLHFPGKTLNCSAVQLEWRAIEEFYTAKKARAIGVSNFCPSTLKCLQQTSTVTPAVNQIQYHVGMPTDQGGIRSTCAKAGIVVQAYSPLGDGTAELITGPLVTKIGSKHGKTGAQVSLRYLYQLGLQTGGSGMPLSTKTIKASYMLEDLQVYEAGFELDAADMKALEAATTPTGNYSFMCTK